jgi:uncharacterized iron-regulated membrane protein
MAAEPAHRGGMGWLGLAGFLTAFTGTYLIAVTGELGFLAPVLAKRRRRCWTLLTTST